MSPNCTALHRLPSNIGHYGSLILLIAFPYTALEKHFLSEPKFFFYESL